MKETRTIKIWTATYRRLKLLAAKSGETLVELLDRLASQEEQKEGKEKV
jgi:hypothetical protein